MFYVVGLIAKTSNIVVPLYWPDDIDIFWFSSNPILQTVEGFIDHSKQTALDNFLNTARNSKTKHLKYKNKQTVKTGNILNKIKQTLFKKNAI